MLRNSGPPEMAVWTSQGYFYDNLSPSFASCKCSLAIETSRAIDGLGGTTKNCFEHVPLFRWSFVFLAWWSSPLRPPRRAPVLFLFCTLGQERDSRQYHLWSGSPLFSCWTNNSSPVSSTVTIPNPRGVAANTPMNSWFRGDVRIFSRGIRAILFFLLQWSESTLKICSSLLLRIPIRLDNSFCLKDSFG